MRLLGNIRAGVKSSFEGKEKSLATPDMKK
jgi:hypothetical protein